MTFLVGPAFKVCRSVLLIIFGIYSPSKIVSSVEFLNEFGRVSNNIIPILNEHDVYSLIQNVSICHSCKNLPKQYTYKIYLNNKYSNYNLTLFVTLKNIY